MEKHPIEGLMSEAMEHIKQMIDVNTIVGNPVTTPDGTTIIPISRVAFGFGAGGSEFSAAPDSKPDGQALFGGGSGGGVSINPVAFLVVNSEQIKLLPVSRSSSTTDKLIDLVPELVNKFNKIANEIMDKKAAKKEAETEIELI
ncbi:MAG: GerW family sporulation protein [Clostridia bacterium]|nr:GerW family sporulation protein [Clostridia bacterium]